MNNIDDTENRSELDRKSLGERFKGLSREEKEQWNNYFRYKERIEMLNELAKAKYEANRKAIEEEKTYSLILKILMIMQAVLIVFWAVITFKVGHWNA